MQKNIVKKFLKTFLLSFLIVSIINIGFIVTLASDNANNIKEKNINNYKNIKTSNIAKTGVAITINLGLRLGDENKITEITMKKIFSVKESEENKELTKEELISKNMLVTREYYSILKTDFKKTLKESKDREKTLESIIDQLQLRFDLGEKQIENLEKQKTIFIAEMEKIEANIEKIKGDINLNFRNTDTKAINKNMDKYLEEKNRFYYFRTLVIFGNKFIAYYKFLNGYNKKLLDTFNLNKDIIIKGSYLVIPENGINILKDYGFLYEENDFKNEIKKQNKN